jgi:hypothetical protein
VASDVLVGIGKGNLGIGFDAPEDFRAETPEVFTPEDF